MSTQLPEPPPEGRLITELRETPPRISRRKAAEQSSYSEARWRQAESGIRWFRGTAYAESPIPAPALADMAFAAGRRHMKPGEIAEHLTRAGRPDAAAELAALARRVEEEERLSPRQRARLARAIRDDADVDDQDT